MTHIHRLIGHGLPFLAVLTLLAACSAADVANVLTSRSGYEAVREIAYGEGPRQSLDLYTPANPRTGAPTLAFFYGGGWVSGDRQDYRFVAQALAADGYPVAVIDYRLSPQVVFPAFVEDGARALGALDGDVVLMGHSAGAQIGALLAYDARYMARAGVPACRIKAFVGLSGPYDFLPLTQPRYRRVFPPETRPASQPIAFVDASDPPALLATGLDDTTVEPRNTTDMASALEAVGVPVRVELYEGLGHVDTIGAFAGPLRGRPVLGDVLSFLDTLATTPSRCR